MEKNQSQSHSIAVNFVNAKTAISKTRLGFEYALNPYLGCAHACVYCYSPYVLREQRPWGRFVDVKKNVADLLAKEVRRIGRDAVVGIGTVTDPYQPLEKDLCLTRKCLEILANARKKFVVQTKSRLIVRDIELLGNAEAGLTITTLRAEIASLIEPYASPPDERLCALRMLGETGIRTFAFVGPVLPSLFKDEKMREDFFCALARAEPSVVMFDKFRVKPGMEEKMRQAFPDLFSRLFAEAFRYAARDWLELIAMLKAEAKKIGLKVGVAETEEWDLR